MGQWTRRNTEIFLLATKGNPKAKNHSISEIVETDFPITVNSKIEKHSKKPDIFRSLILDICGNLPRVELFARNKFEGWDSFGNEVPSDVKFNE